MNPKSEFVTPCRGEVLLNSIPPRDDATDAPRPVFSKQPVGSERSRAAPVSGGNDQGLDGPVLDVVLRRGRRLLDELVRERAGGQHFRVVQPLGDLDQRDCGRLHLADQDGDRVQVAEDAERAGPRAGNTPPARPPARSNPCRRASPRTG